jgi:hypothetical protein
MVSRFTVPAAVTALAALAACDRAPTAPTDPTPNFGVAETGNGAPSGSHYTLNIIGVPKDKNPNFTGGEGRRIFVKLWGQDTKIILTEGAYDVTDADGTDGTAGFQLPNPDPDGDYKTNYSVYVRALGKPERYALMQTCYTDATGTWCAVDFDGGVSQITIERSKKGVSQFENVTKDLLFVDFCTTWVNGVCTNVEHIPLFSDKDLTYFWDYDNFGLKVAQLRFYEVPTEVTF